MVYELSREIRFAVEPFSNGRLDGGNSYCCKPGSEGLGVFLCLRVTLSGELDDRTGFVVNVSDVDSAFREKAVGIFEDGIRVSYAAGNGVNFGNLYEMIKECGRLLSGCFEGLEVSRVELILNPYRSIYLESRYDKMYYFTEKFEFAATHKLWNEELSEAENFKCFGACANKTGHGHNYIVEVTVCRGEDEGGIKAGAIEKVVKDNFIEVVDHKNLNVDVEYFVEHNPTVENISSFAYECLRDKFDGVHLESVTVWENDRTYCSYRQ
jgi:6-pyruvoyltetrahydropterin/6-carboxytetrahydropterin synthase